MRLRLNEFNQPGDGGSPRFVGGLVQYGPPLDALFGQFSAREGQSERAPQSSWLRVEVLLVYVVEGQSEQTPNGAID